MNNAQYHDGLHRRADAYKHNSRCRHRRHGDSDLGENITSRNYFQLVHDEIDFNPIISITVVIHISEITSEMATRNDFRGNGKHFIFMIIMLSPGSPSAQFE